MYKSNGTAEINALNFAPVPDISEVNSMTDAELHLAIADEEIRTHYLSPFDHRVLSRLAHRGRSDCFLGGPSDLRLEPDFQSEVWTKAARDLGMVTQYGTMLTVMLEQPENVM